ncbi:4Fe-4S binding protein [candidate division WOR-3 bacterium]|nr:4Fe-4S binding protein [candidate division WOR-3 bacterium]
MAGFRNRWRKPKLRKKYGFPTIFIQAISAFILNSYFYVFKRPSLYQGKGKGLICPSLNCYSCPLAYTSCPIGIMQHFAIIRQFPYYLLGWLGLVGVTTGRAQCGWICPFGLIQDLLYSIGRIRLKLPKWTIYIKYVVLFGMIPLSFITLDPVFCEYICPAGTLEAGIPQVLWISDYRQLVGHLFVLKVSILVIIVLLSILIKRPFCRTLCPLGAFYSIFNKISVMRMKVDMDRCIECDLCQEVCPMDIKIYENPDSLECIRCNKCIRICPTNAISVEIFGKEKRLESKLVVKKRR